MGDGEWKDISTAPKDGLLVYLLRKSHFVRHYRGRPRPYTYRVLVGKWQFEKWEIKWPLSAPIDSQTLMSWAPVVLSNGEVDYGGYPDIPPPIASEDEIIKRRFGRYHDKPCVHLETLTCALWECQKLNRCKDAPPPHSSSGGDR